MNDPEFRLLLDNAYATWRDCLDAHAALARKVAGGASVCKSEQARVRADLDRALRDFVSMSAQTDPDVPALKSESVTAAQMTIARAEYTVQIKPENVQRQSAD